MKSRSGSDWVGVQPDDPKPIIYLSGNAHSVGTTPEALFAATGHRFYCLSYIYCAPRAPRFMKFHAQALDFYRAQGLRSFLDSGAHTFQELLYNKMGIEGKDAVAKLDSAKRVESMVAAYAEEYATYVRGFPAGTFDFYVNLDYRIHAPTIYKMLKRFQKELKIQPIPVYHGDRGTEWLKKYVDEGHKLIGIGWDPSAHSYSKRRKYYDRVFDFAAKEDLKLHGFACTGKELFSYPWYSVDSTTWIKVAAYGAILDFTPDGQGRPRFNMYHISERKLSAALKDDPELVKRATARNMTIEDLRASYAARAIYNIHSYQEAVRTFVPQQSRVLWRTSLC